MDMGTVVCGVFVWRDDRVEGWKWGERRRGWVDVEWMGVRGLCRIRFAVGYVSVRW